MDYWWWSEKRAGRKKFETEFEQCTRYFEMMKKFSFGDKENASMEASVDDDDELWVGGSTHLPFSCLHA
jgi:hypothetical protein